MEMRKPCQEKAAGPIKINLKKEPAAPKCPEPATPVAGAAAAVKAPLVADAKAAVPVPVPVVAGPSARAPKLEPINTVHMSSGEQPIEVTNKSPIVYRNCSTFDAELNKVGLYWDMLIVSVDFTVC